MKLKPFMYPAIIVIAVCVCYGLSLQNGFVWDDILLVVQNDLIKGWKLFAQLFSKTLFYVTNPAYQYYRPLQSFTYILDHTLWGLLPMGFHLSNILIHVCVSLLTFVFIRSLSGSAGLAFWAGLLYAVHPVHTTTVCYVSGRADMLMVLFTTMSLLLFLYSRTWHLRLLSVLFFAAALFSKETALVLPACLVMVCLMRACLCPGPQVLRLRWYAVYFGIAFAYVFLRSLMGLNAHIIPQTYPAFSVAAATFIRIIVSYMRLIFFPVPVAMIRTLTLAAPSVVPAVFASVLFAVLFYVIRRFARPLLVWLGLSFLWVIPVISLAFRNPEYYNQGLVVVQAHWLYPALAGMCVLFVFGIQSAARFIGTRSANAVLALCVIALSVLTIRENPHWKDNLTFFTHTAGYATKSPTVLRNLGWIYLSRRDATNALSAYEQALELETQDKAKAAICRDLSVAYARVGRMKEARGAAERSVRFDAGYAFGYAQLGALDVYEEKDTAEENLLKALKIDLFCAPALDNLLELSKADSDLRYRLLRRYQEFLAGHKTAGFDDYKAYLILGLLRLQEGDIEQALADLERAARLNPYDVTVTNALAVCYAQKGAHSRALHFFKRSLKLNPYNPEAYRNLSLLLDNLGLTEEARRLMKKSSAVNAFN